MHRGAKYSLPSLRQSSTVNCVFYFFSHIIQTIEPLTSEENLHNMLSLLTDEKARNSLFLHSWQDLNYFKWLNCDQSIINRRFFRIWFVKQQIQMHASSIEKYKVEETVVCTLAVNDNRTKSPIASIQFSSCHLKDREIFFISSI